jgi:hypothetical protein
MPRLSRAVLMGILGTFLCASGIAGSMPGDAGAYEDEVKAAYLYHFTRYLEWPGEQAPRAFDIAVLGDSGIVVPLQEIARKKTVGSLPIAVRQVLDLAQIGRPRILFIARTASRWLPQVLEKTRGKECLTVSEEEGLAASGTAVNFILRDGAVKFEMNEKALKEARIQPSAQLLKLAILVDPAKKEGGP